MAAARAAQLAASPAASDRGVATQGAKAGAWHSSNI